MRQMDMSLRESLTESQAAQDEKVDLEAELED